MTDPRNSTPCPVCNHDCNPLFGCRFVDNPEREYIAEYGEIVDIDCFKENTDA